MTLQTTEQHHTCMLVSRVSTDDRPSANRKGAGNPGGRVCPSEDSSVSEAADGKYSFKYFGLVRLWGKKVREAAQFVM